MKKFKIFTIAAATLSLALASCSVHDPFADNMDLGQIVPTVSWEFSTVAKAGGMVKFTGKYYTSSEHRIDHSEVWAMVTRESSASATCMLTTSLKYTKTVNTADTVRNAYLIQKYDHSKAEWDGHEYVLVDSFPVSQTFVPVTWYEPETWDQDRFDLYYPSTFQEEFKSTVINYLTRDSVYYNDVRGIYINYDFTPEQIAAVNAKYGVSIPLETESANKSDLWFTADEIDHYYYITVDDAGVKVEHEIANESDAPSGVNVYPVYKSAPWVYSRYSDDTGGRVNAIRQAYMPAWKELLEQIPFTDWIYNNSNKSYNVVFTRNYFLVPFFRVFDENGKMGTDTEIKTIDLN